jgi:ADP-heptose:LPS heptosyltransferase
MIFEIPDEPAPLPDFKPSEEGKRALMSKLEELNGSALSGPVIILNPNTGDLLPIRRWPEERFIELGRMIRGEHKEATIIITGTPEEREEACRVASGIDGALCLAGETSLEELLTLYSISDALITNDSGPAHFSSMTPIKSVILFGPETPLLYGEKGPSRVNMSPGLVCSPCVNVYNHRHSSCLLGTCLKGTSAREVFDRLKSLL